MRSILLATTFLTLAAASAVAQGNWPRITSQAYGLSRDDGRLASEFGQLMTLTVGQDATSAYLSFQGAPANLPVFVLLAAKSAYAQLPWGDLVLVDNVVAVLTVTPKASEGDVEAKVRFDRRVLVHSSPIQFYLQAFTADLTGQFPMLTSHGADVIVQPATRG